MAIASYSDLKTKVKLWAEREDISDDLIDDFIYMTESTAMNNLRVPAMENTEVVASLNGTLTIPFDFLELRRLQGPDAVDGPVLEYVPWDTFVYLIHNVEASADPSSRYFSRQGSKWFLWPEVADGTEYIVHYYRTFDQLEATNPTTWLLELSPQSYLYGCLGHLFDFIMDQERALYWQEKFMKELSQIQDMAVKAEHRGSLLTVRNPNIGSIT